MSTEHKPRRWVKTFKPEFSDLVEMGLKSQTIRPIPKRLPQAGDIIDARMWRGLPYRSKMVKLGEWKISDARYIRISQNDSVTMCGTPREVLFTPTELNEFAIADGFTDWREMRDWFQRQHGLPFDGILIQWDPL